MTYFKLFSNCISIKGASQSIICDLQRRDIFHIPNDLYSILSDLKNRPLKLVLEEFESEDQEAILSWIKKIEAEELGFYCDDTTRFPDLSLDFDSPEHINNCIIEYGSVSNFNWPLIFKELAEVGCKFLELRITKTITLEELEEILLLTKETNIRGIELALAFQNTEYTKKFELILLKHQRVVSILVHSIENPENVIESSEPRLMQIIEKIDSNLCCGNIGKPYFVSTVNFFTESLKFNNCLNKKISITENGNIKNCPSMTESFGVVGEISFKSVLAIKNFKAKWSITKDNVAVCKDCEYRYICSDCRVYLEDPNDPLSKPLKCGYDPYEGEWTNWMENSQKRSTFEDYKLNQIC